MTLAFSIELPTYRADAPQEFLTASAIAEVARSAEECGFGAVHVTDHPAGDAKWLDSGGHQALDPFVPLTVAATATERIRLLTYMYIPAYRNPFLTAKSALSVHVISGGRLILGLGAGYLRPEFGALGVDFEERNELFDETIKIARRAWSGEDVSFQGRHFRARGVRMLPALPVPPALWVGGNSKAAIRRAVTSAQGWAPFRSGPFASTTRTVAVDDLEGLRPLLRYCRDQIAQTGRQEQLDICFVAGPAGDPEISRVRRLAYVEELEAEGIGWAALALRADSVDGLKDQMRRFADDIIHR